MLLFNGNAVFETKIKTRGLIGSQLSGVGGKVDPNSPPLKKHLSLYLRR
jgi:hypothetical protein